MTLRMCGLLVAATLAALGSSVPEAADAQSIRFRMQSGYSPTLSVIGQTAGHFANLVEKLSGGEMAVDYMEPGALVPSPEIFDAVGAGRIDMGYSWSGYQAGKIPAILVFIGVPFGPGHEILSSWLTEGGGSRMMNELYAPFGVHSLPCGLTPAEPSGWFREEISNPDRLKGMKIRYAGLAADVMAKLGASPTLIPGNETFAALERGVIDAAEFSLPSIDKDTGFYMVAKHYYFPGWHQTSSTQELLINKDLWEGLTARQRAIFETACSDSMRYMVSIALPQQGAALRFYEQEGVTIHTWSDEMLAVFRRAAAEVMAERSAADPDFARAWDSLKSYARDISTWSDIAFLK